MKLLSLMSTSVCNIFIRVANAYHRTEVVALKKQSATTSSKAAPATSGGKSTARTSNRTRNVKAPVQVRVVSKKFTVPSTYPKGTRIQAVPDPDNNPFYDEPAVEGESASDVEEVERSPRKRFVI